ARLEECHQIGQIAWSQLLVEAGRHDGDLARLNVFDVFSCDAGLLIRCQYQNHLVRGLLLDQAVIELAALRGDGNRLVTPHQAGAREDDRFEQIAFAANAADFCEIRTDTAAEIADRVTRRTGSLGSVENYLAPPD